MESSNGTAGMALSNLEVFCWANNGYIILAVRKDVYPHDQQTGPSSSQVSFPLHVRYHIVQTVGTLMP